MAAPFVSPSTEGKPEVPEWVPPEPTKMDLDWADLHSIDLSLLDSDDPKVVEGLIKLTKTAIKEDGFLYLTNYGVSLEQLHRQFDLAQYLHDNISESDKARLLWDPSTGLFAGFKRRMGWKREAGEFDGIEQFNFYAGEFADPENKVPGCIKPFFDEITAFCNYMTNSVNRRLLKLLSRVLELPDDYLWEHVQAKDGPVGDGYFRHALFYPLPKEDKERRKAVRMYGHTDYGTTTLLFSVPVTALHIWSKKNKWQPVKYNPGALVVNIGDALEIISGGHFKATRHKVADTPADQEHLQRLSLVQFNGSIGGIKLAPVLESPLIQREGLILEQGVFREYKALMDAGLPVPTNKEWREIQISTRQQIPPEERLGGVQEINGVKYGADNFFGVEVLLPV
ncbi:Clavaminate synthase-like protein [Pleurostoma richardsiae]|uniref:Clavaminate synthase-like protein n=1 Tax=Pleurostoma richardsiae TaxID=41990 RepID=A0AA38VIB3_9PEZI|nr:Clavaminate synthase-like protein [Pleurostoma richardsiae]